MAQIEKNLYIALQLCHVDPVLALSDGPQHGCKLNPVLLNPAVVLLQSFDGLHDLGVGAGQQGREHVFFFLRMMLARGA